MICPTCHTENRTEDRFCGECGAPLPAVNAAEGDGGVGEAPQPSLNGAVLRRVGTDDDARYKLGDRTMIGRQDTCNIVVKDPSISREHALITRLDDTYVIEDLFSTNGTTVNGRPCKGPVTLHSGDMVSVGAIDLQCEVEGAQTVFSPSASGDITLLDVAGGERFDANGAETEGSMAMESEPDSELPPAYSPLQDPGMDTREMPDFPASDSLPPALISTGALEPPTPGPLPAVAQVANGADTQVDRALKAAEELHEALVDLSHRIGESEAERNRLLAASQALEETNRRWAPVRAQLLEAQVALMALDELQPVVEDLAANPRDIGVLTRIAEHAESLRSLLNENIQLRHALQGAIDALDIGPPA